VSGASVWDEGGTNRTALHIAGGALIGGLGGGGFGTALQGAAGAGVSSAFAGKLNGIADQIGDATGSMTVGNLVSNVLAGVGGALVGGSAGAFTASNADLYNRSTGNGDGKGGTGSDFLDRLGDAIRSTADDPLGALNHALNTILPAPPSQKPDADANPLIDVHNGGNNTPGATAVVTPPAYAMTPEGPVPIGPGVSVPGYAPGNATLSSGGSGQSTNDSPASSNAGFDPSNLESKLGGYLLDPTHSQNQTKANWFSQALGFDQSNWQDLAKQLYFDPATAVPTKATQYGQTYEQVISITGVNGKTIDTTFVFMKDNSGTVRLVTGIPTKK
jgi:hypothetical protein